MKTLALSALAALSFLAGSVQAQTAFRPPAVPLVTHDPYFSVWSMGDQLAGDWPKHWTGAAMGMTGMVRIDGKAYRWCGPEPRDVPAMKQTSVKVEATSTTYTFEAGGVQFGVVFATDMPVDDLAAASRPTTWVLVTTAATDGKPHEATVYLDVSGEWVTNSPDQRVTWDRKKQGGAEVLSMASVDQKVLERAGDGVRIDWGRMYLAAESAAGVAHMAVAGHNTARGGFAGKGELPAKDDARKPRAANDDWPVMAATAKLDPTGGTIQAFFTLAYDDEKSIELMGKPLQAYWKHKGMPLMPTGGGVTMGITRGDAVSSTLRKASMPFGAAYADMTTLAYRQVLAGHKIVAGVNGEPLMFAKENSSNGCIATVDVIYPACPFFLYHNPAMLRAQLKPLMDYSASPRWKFPFAPHDLGTYPKANGQVYGGGEKGEENQMPVEESGNMLIMLAALAKVEKSGDFSKPYLPTIAKWAQYLKEHGLDPENQLCTDDFAGHLARNANLSAKTVVALGAYAQLLEACGDKAGAAAWAATAKDYARKWQDLSKDGEGTVLVFGKPGTWSQKYNLVWDRVLGLNLFPQEVFDREAKLYRSKMQKFGLPLDSRKMYTKLDWTVWSACLTGRRADFDAVMTPVFAWVNETPTRVPLSDWYETDNGRQTGFQARTVVGGVWMPLLMEKMGVGLK